MHISCPGYGAAGGINPPGYYPAPAVMVVEYAVMLTERYPGIIAASAMPVSGCAGRVMKNRKKKRISYYPFTIFQTFGVVIRNSPDSLNDPR